jgi:hypothetical protein
MANHGPKCEKRERHREVDQVGGHRASLYDAQDKARRMAAYRPLFIGPNINDKSRALRRLALIWQSARLLQLGSLGQQLQSLALTPIERFLIVDAWTARVAKSA